MENEIENEREAMLMVTVPHNDVWYTLRYETTDNLSKLDRDDAIETFEVAVKNIRARLLKIYEGEK